MFNNIRQPNSAFAAGEMRQEEEKKEKEKQDGLMREFIRDAHSQEYNNKSLAQSQKSIELSEKAIKLASKSYWVMVWTLIIALVAAIFSVLAYFEQ